MAYVLNETPAESLAGKVDEAIEECPTAAISRKA
jgi:ferredoxin